VGYRGFTAMTKYKNKRVKIDGYTFDSIKESRRYTDLKLLQRAKKIHELRVHPIRSITINGFLITRYTADFDYVDVRTGKVIIEDVKPSYSSEASRKRYQATQAYRMFDLKKKLIRSIHGIEVIEI
jgi:hypothetical protein